MLTRYPHSIEIKMWDAWNKWIFDNIAAEQERQARELRESFQIEVANEMVIACLNVLAKNGIVKPYDEEAFMEANNEFFGTFHEYIRICLDNS